MALVMEYMNYGTLAKFINRNSQAYSEESCRNILWQIAQGLMLMHQRWEWGMQ